MEKQIRDELVQTLNRFVLSRTRLLVFQQSLDQDSQIVKDEQEILKSLELSCQGLISFHLMEIGPIDFEDLSHALKAAMIRNLVTLELGPTSWPCIMEKIQELDLVGGFLIPDDPDGSFSEAV